MRSAFAGDVTLGTKMFAGTPRPHKGLPDLVQAFRSVRLPQAQRSRKVARTGLALRRNRRASCTLPARDSGQS